MSEPKALPAPGAPPQVTSLMERLTQVAPHKTSAWLDAPKTAAQPARPLFVKEAPAAPLDVIVAQAATVAAENAAAAAELEQARKDVEKARAEAEKEGLETAKTKIEEIVERYLDGIQRLLAATRLAHRPEPGEVVELALVVAKEIVGRELSVDRSQLLGTIDRSLGSVSADTQLVLRVSPGDATYVKQRRPELLRDGVVIVEDKALTVGGCVVETPAWVLDASIEARLDAVRAGLVEIVTAGANDETRDDEPAVEPIEELEDPEVIDGRGEEVES